MAKLSTARKSKPPTSYFHKHEAGRFYFLRQDVEIGYAWFCRDDLPNEKRSPLKNKEGRHHWASMIEARLSVHN